FSLLVTVGDKNPVGAFLFFFIFGGIFSYGAATFLFLPALFLLSRFTTLRFYKVCLVGTLLGAAVFFPVTWVMWESSGPDSGPPEAIFFAFFSGSWGEALTWCFPVGGLITAVAYWLLAKEPRRGNVQASEETPLLPRSL